MNWTKATFSLFFVATLAPSVARAEILTLDKCVSIALKESPDVTSADYGVDAAAARKLSARGAWGPRLRLDAGVQRWDKELGAQLFAAVPATCTNCQWNTQQGQTINLAGRDVPAGNLNDLLAPIVLRPQWTWSVGATLAQPIASLWTVREANELAKLGIDVAEIKRKSARRDVAYQVTEAYFRLLQVKRIEEVAQRSVEQVATQVKRAATFFERGVVARNDVLRAELGLAAAQQRLIQARGAVTLARGRLATLMGRSPDSDIDAQDIPGEPATETLMPPTQAEQAAVSQRLELREVASRIDQATAGIRMSESKMLPQVNAVANSTRQTQSLFGLPSSWFVGATASWDIWEGGGTYYGISESKAQLAQALEARRKAEDMIRFDARSAHVGVTTAAEALVVARHAVEQAEENFRIEQKRYESASNTSFDVLDAESQLTTARGQHQAAIYDYVIAQSNLARAMGEKHPAMKSVP
jgi:outer membrane protein TolC